MALRVARGRPHKPRAELPIAVLSERLIERNGRIHSTCECTQSALTVTGDHAHRLRCDPNRRRACTHGVTAPIAKYFD